LPPRKNLGTRGASFWNGGAGPSADAEGNIYVVSANGDFDGGSVGSEYDESVLKLTQTRLSVADLFTPFNKKTLDQNDLDLGSSGALVLPDEAGSPAHPHLVFTSGKEGRMYLLDRQSLGGVQVGGDFRALAALPVLSSHGTFGMAAYFKGSIYIAPANSPVLAFPVADASLASSPSARTSDSHGNHGATPSISANGNQNGIVWIISENNGGKLLAYDASDLKQLYDSNAQPADSLYYYGYTEFSVPTIADGKVFVGTVHGIAVYGELASDPPFVSAITNAASYAPDVISPGSLISVFGSGLAASTSTAPSAPLPLSLADTSVTINGVVAPLLFVSPQQINAQVPYGIAAGPAAVVIRTTGVPSPPVTVTIRPAAPGIFNDSHGQAAALNADGSPNSVLHPASVGSFVSVFFTGQGPVKVHVEDGAAPPAGSRFRLPLPCRPPLAVCPRRFNSRGWRPVIPARPRSILRFLRSRAESIHWL
jgi:uncharacterized protein (TIGR03437 family)